MGKSRKKESKFAQTLPVFEEAAPQTCCPTTARVLTKNYQPLPSVWEGTDAELLERMLDFYPKKPPSLILDATLNAGRFWEGSQLLIVGIDIDLKHHPN